MSLPLIDFKPAQLVDTKRETYVSYYAKNPFSGKLERKRVRLNHISPKSERRKFGLLLCAEITNKLYSGWNPFMEALEEGGISVSAAVDEFVAVKSKSLRPDSLRSYRSLSGILKSWLSGRGAAGRPCALFGRREAEQFMRDMERRDRLSNKTYNNYLRFYSTLFLWFAKRGYIKENPFGGIERKRAEAKTRETIPPADRKLIADWFVAQGMTEYLYIMQLCYRLFVRPKEILMLKVGNIDFGEGLVTIPASVSKNHHERVVAVPKEIMSYLLTLKDLNPRLYVFSDGYKPGTRLLSTRDTGRTWSRMRDALGLPKSYQFYSLKDTGITEMLEQGVPAKYVKELADHSSLEMTEKYTHKSDAKKILEYNKLEF